MKWYDSRQSPPTLSGKVRSQLDPVDGPGVDAGDGDELNIRRGDDEQMDDAVEFVDASWSSWT